MSLPFLLADAFLFFIFVFDVLIFESRQGHYWIPIFLLYIFLFVGIAEKNLSTHRILLTQSLLCTISVILSLSLIYSPHLCLTVYLIGGFLNCLVMSANEGKMPFANLLDYCIHNDKRNKPLCIIGSSSLVRHNFNDFRHKDIDQKTKMLVLCDKIFIGDKRIMSIGDVLLYISEMVALIHLFV